ncbi:hypothetical protein ElyMa_006500400 [Elysia marginata]|uniref:Uncharacterized protein n=1 Tax=Elysia marginata TaxID=1093978 RepID=A0AAV4I2G0_9GAST|nr:hypothetical protein ElyMa_006500400 [Elysia marginata]
MFVLGKRDELKKLGLGVGNDLTAFQRKELQELREKGKRGFYRNGRLRIDETPLTRVTPPRRQDQPWRKLTLQQHQPPPSPPRDNLEPNARQQRKSPAQLTREAASTQRGSQNRHDLRLSAVQQQQTYPTVPGGSPERSGTRQQSSPARASTRETAARAQPLTSPTNLDESAQHLFTEGVRRGRPLTRSQQRREDSDEATTGPTAASTYGDARQYGKRCSKSRSNNYSNSKDRMRRQSISSVLRESGKAV